MSELKHSLVHSASQALEMDEARVRVRLALMNVVQAQQKVEAIREHRSKSRSMEFHCSSQVDNWVSTSPKGGSRKKNLEKNPSKPTFFSWIMGSSSQVK